jgi:nucleoside-diphosphate-sugar epimerase
MAVLITGGYGHIGSWTAYHLAQAGEQVIIYDAKPTMPDYLEPVAENITFERGNVLDFPRLTAVFQKYQGTINGIIHTIGVMGEMVQIAPYENVNLNINGTHHILEIARIFKIPKVVYTSTGAVYPPVTGVVAEDDMTPKPSDLYGATKLSSEYLGLHYASTFGFEFRIARLYFCYGPGKYPSDFVRLYQMAFGALEGMDGLQMDQGADQKVDFSYIEDVGRGTALLYQAGDIPHSIYNIATGVPTSINDVVALAQRYSLFSVEVKLGPGTLMERAEALDISRAKADLGFTPQYTLEEGIQRYAKWMAENPRR